MSDEILYMPFDGDYDASRSETLGRFATDLLGETFVEDDEILLSFLSKNDPPIYRYAWNKTPIQPPKIKICSPRDEGWDVYYDDLPAGWQEDDVAELFQYGDIYFHHPPNKAIQPTPQPGPLPE